MDLLVGLQSNHLGTAQGEHRTARIRPKHVRARRSGSEPRETVGICPAT
ncbi:hypothetical protein [Streptomyces sp. NPDC056544]